jgi:hypothetical protein
MRLKINSKAFQKDMKNIIDYSVGFLDGIHSGKKVFLDNLGKESVDLIKDYVDSNARVDPEMLHHIYEWNQTGSPSARLFDIDYTVSNLGLSFKSSLSQSQSVKDGSTVPFYDKARIMENGIPVVIRPIRAQVLSFDSNGEEVFTKGPVEILNPGGTAVEGGLEKTLDSFFKYFSQAFLRSSGVAQHMENPVAYKKNLAAGSRRGRALGVSTGYRWIINAGAAN